MTNYIFDYIVNNNNNITLYCLKNFQTFIINITININNDNEINNNINNNNYGSDYYLFNNNNNEQCLLEKTNCNLNIIQVFQGNYNIQSVEDFRLQHPNLFQSLIWINILGRLALD